MDWAILREIFNVLCGYEEIIVRKERNDIKALKKSKLN